MCDPRRALVVATLLALGVGSAAAQTPPDGGEISAQALRRRLADLAPRLRDAQAKAEAADRIAYSRFVPPASAGEAVMVGPLRIVASSSQAAEARELFQEQWRIYEPLFGDRVQRFGDIVFTFHHGTADAPGVPGGRVRPTELGLFASRAALRETVRNNLGISLVEALPPSMRAWEGGFPLTPPDAETLELVRRDLTLSPSAFARACLDGTADACWGAMGVLPQDVELLPAWYEPADLMLMVAREMASTTTPGAKSLAGRCLREHAEACSEWLLAFKPIESLIPASVRARESLLWFALDRGGPGALDRMQDALSGPDGNWFDWRTDAFMAGRGIRLALEAASGTDADALMKAWQASLHVEVAEANPIEPRGGTRTASLLWILLFAGLATRSTRWRLG